VYRIFLALPGHNYTIIHHYYPAFCYHKSVQHIPV
jgi:hypothetical protein